MGGDKCGRTLEGAIEQFWEVTLLRREQVWEELGGSNQTILGGNIVREGTITAFQRIFHFGRVLKGQIYKSNIKYPTNLGYCTI